MKDFISDYCHRNDCKINDDVFTRAYDRPLHEYIVETCKGLEVIPAITLESWELITDQTKIHSVVNKKLSKDPKIKNNKTLERLTQANQTLYDMLILNFRVKAKGRDVAVQRKVRILKQDKYGMYLRNGRKVRILNQVVDNSTFVKGTKLSFKTRLYSIQLDTKAVKLKFLDDETATCQCFQLDLLYKVTNPLLYYLAEYGIERTIEMFSLDRVISVVDSPLDDHYMYLPVSDEVYIEVHEKAFYAHEFVGMFVATLYDAIHGEKKKERNATLQDVYSTDYWKECLSEVFSKKRNVNKALRVLISFNKIVDSGVKRPLLLKKFHKKNTFTILRWMMVNYQELLKKDSHDLRYKRVRANETLAYFFDKHVSKNVYSLLNTDKPSFEKYIRLLNSINEWTLLKGVHGGGTTSPTSMFRYERYNDFDAIEISRYTLKGPTGLNGGKKRTSMQYRDIYPSHLGRYDLNVCSSSDPGLTGYLCANVKLDKNGYFEAKDCEPDDYDMVIDALIDRIAEPDYVKKRSAYVQMQLSRDDEGFIRLKRKLTPEEMNEEFLREPEKYGMFRTADGLRLLPKMDSVDPKGFYVLIHRRTPKEESQMERDTDGFLVLRPIVTRLSKAKNRNK